MVVRHGEGIGGMFEAGVWGGGGGGNRVINL